MRTNTDALSFVNCAGVCPTSSQKLIAELLLDGWQIESKDEKELTISKKLGVSSRTIRNWLKEGRTILADYNAEVKK